MRYEGGTCWWIGKGRLEHRDVASMAALKDVMGARRKRRRQTTSETCDWSVDASGDGDSEMQRGRNLWERAMMWNTTKRGWTAKTKNDDVHEVQQKGQTGSHGANSRDKLHRAGAVLVRVRRRTEQISTMIAAESTGPGQANKEGYEGGSRTGLAREDAHARFMRNGS